MAEPTVDQTDDYDYDDDDWAGCDHVHDDECYDYQGFSQCLHQHCFSCGECGCPGYCDDYQTYNLRPDETGGGEDRAAGPAADITSPQSGEPAACPDHRPVLDSAVGWYCPACGSDAPPDGSETDGGQP